MEGISSTTWEREGDTASYFPELLAADPLCHRLVPVTLGAGSGLQAVG